MNVATYWDQDDPYPELAGMPVDPALLQPVPAAAPVAVVVDTTDATPGYQRVGQITSQALLDAPGPLNPHLDDRIAEATEWVQGYLSDNGLVEQVVAARLSGSRADAYNDIAREIDRLALQYVSRESVVHGADVNYLVAAVMNEILGLSVLEPLMRDDRITEVMVNGCSEVYVEIAGREYPVPGARFRNQEHLLDVCQRIVRPIGRSIDQRNSTVDARLPDGSRVNIVHQVLAADGPILTVRKFPERTWTLADLIAAGSINEDIAADLAFLVRGKCNVLVAGSTGSGKSSLLNALSGAIPTDQRTITIEDSRELRLHPAAHWVALEARSGGASADGAVTIRDLVRNALRMRPVRIVVGEVRGSETVDMLQAMNTGHEGSLSTVHSNGPEETIDRLLTMISLGGEMTVDLAAKLINSAIDVIVYIDRSPDGSRRVSSIHQVRKHTRNDTSSVELDPLWVWHNTGVDDDGRDSGYWERVGEVSPELRRLRQLPDANPISIDDVHEMSATDQGSA